MIFDKVISWQSARAKLATYVAPFSKRSPGTFLTQKKPVALPCSERRRD